MVKQKETTLKNKKADSNESKRQYFLKVLNQSFSERNDVNIEVKYVKDLKSNQSSFFKN